MPGRFLKRHDQGLVGEDEHHSPAPPFPAKAEYDSCTGSSYIGCEALFPKAETGEGVCAIEIISVGGNFKAETLRNTLILKRHPGRQEAKLLDARLQIERQQVPGHKEMERGAKGKSRAQRKNRSLDPPLIGQGKIFRESRPSRRRRSRPKLRLVELEE
ncbi:hypothetical protein SKAU_G00192220 [Synaphobranchus kaupii]|uniref:Uncharacterized protein n=1 Tax=Synaphobranchus kaupii TaxID=118154 RepID=A0A9Q1FE84_SYNKA|nr:hypothetical protein SKAU_G00192220 [Synaphobranchus kaupii]